jgi:hypothetical protein
MTQAPKTVRALNDAFRAAGPSAGDWMLTPGVLALGVDAIPEVVEAVRCFDRFTEKNDPYTEHDFGAVEILGEKIFWKIDYYDITLTYGSENPADSAVTRRVMTIMLASDY